MPLPAGPLPLPDLRLVRTADGSFTLDSPALGGHYHSLHGAMAEGRHIYIAQGLQAVRKIAIDVLEVGLGTGLNALLTWEDSERAGKQVSYLALEPFPVPAELCERLGHPLAIGAPARQPGYRAMMRADPGRTIRLSPQFIFRWEQVHLQEWEACEAFDLVYFDAFSPRAQPAMWTLDVFRRIQRAMRPGAVMVTYCVKGEVRRTMAKAGLVVERLPGPPGKRQMLRATKPL